MLIDQENWLKVNFPFIDVHTHNTVISEDVISVPSLFLQELDFQSEIKSTFSAAIHPFHAQKFTLKEVAEMLNNLVKQPGLIAIGETGLDKICFSDYNTQKALFELHIEFARAYHKPLILHVVKSWSDLIGYLRHINVPFIVHGYSEGVELTKHLIDLGCYFSLGKSVLSIFPRLRESIQIIPISSLFIETDNSNVQIQDIYQKVAEIRNISLYDLKIQINKNFSTFFFGSNIENE